MQSNVTATSGILQLSDDILSIICDLVLPIDFDAFHSTCRRIHSIAAGKRLLIHESLKEQYGNYELINIHPGSLLHAIWEDFFIGHYITSLTYQNNDRWSGNDRTYQHVTQETRDKLQQCSSDLLSESQYLSPGSSVIDIDRLEEGDESPAFAILLTLLPNLRHLKLLQPFWSTETVYKTIQRCQSHTIDKSQYIFSCAPLSQLKSVEVRPGSIRVYRSLSHLAVWASVPSLQKMAAATIVADEQYPYVSFQEDSETTRSAVQVLEMSNSIIEPRYLQKLLASMTQLKELRYHQCESKNLADPSNFAMPAQELVSIIQTTVGSTLRALSLSGGIKETDVSSLTGESEKLDPVKSFKGFHMLRELELDGSFLFTPESDEHNLSPDPYNLRAGATGDEEEVEAPALVDILPESLVSLSINVEDLDEDEEIRPLFDRWEEEQTKALPNLAKVTYGGPMLEGEFEEMIKSTGISLVHKSQWRPTFSSR